MVLKVCALLFEKSFSYSTSAVQIIMLSVLELTNEMPAVTKSGKVKGKQCVCPCISACLISCWSRTSSKLQGVFCAVEFSPQIFSPGQNHRGSFALLGTIPPFNMDIGAEVLRSFIYYSLKGEFLFSAFEGSLPRL